MRYNDTWVFDINCRAAFYMMMRHTCANHFVHISYGFETIRRLVHQYPETSQSFLTAFFLPYYVPMCFFPVLILFSHKPSGAVACVGISYSGAQIAVVRIYGIMVNHIQTHIHGILETSRA